MGTTLSCLSLAPLPFSYTAQHWDSLLSVVLGCRIFDETASTSTLYGEQVQPFVVQLTEVYPHLATGRLLRGCAHGNVSAPSACGLEVKTEGVVLPNACQPIFDITLSPDVYTSLLLSKSHAHADY